MYPKKDHYAHSYLYLNLGRGLGECTLVLKYLLGMYIMVHFLVGMCLHMHTCTYTTDVHIHTKFRYRAASLILLPGCYLQSPGVGVASLGSYGKKRKKYKMSLL